MICSSTGSSQASSTYMTEPATLETIMRQHNDILKAIRDRDPDAAYSAMREHIIFVLDFVNGKKVS